MKFFIVLAAAFFSVMACYSQTENNIDVLHYRFEIGLSDDSDTITGKATIRIAFTAASSQLMLDLVAADNGKGMTVSSVTEHEKPLETIHKGNHLTIRLPVEAKPGDTSQFIINYYGVPAEGLIITKNKYGHRTFCGDNWPNRGKNWIPCHDDPVDKAPVEFIVTAPQHYQVVANGVQIEETNLSKNMKLTHWREDTPLATKVMVIGAADFAVNLAGMVNCIPVYSWVYPEDRYNGFSDYAQATSILPFFIDNVGPYGYKKLANVESKTTYGGLENANTIFYSETSITGTGSDEDLLTHEIAHQWFGNMATEKSFAHLWLSEGFATYFTILYFENKYGPDSAMHMRQKDRMEAIAFSKVSNHPVVDKLTTDYMQLLNANSYQKGGWVLHMLRRQLGDKVFWKGIREYYATYAGKNADTDDLRAIFEKVSGTDLRQFFKQWLYTQGQPGLAISWKATAGKKIQVTLKQTQEQIFIFPLEIAMQTKTGRTKLEKINITKKVETFILDNTDKVINIVLDPHSDLLFEELPPVTR